MAKLHTYNTPFLNALEIMEDREFNSSILRSKSYSDIINGLQTTIDPDEIVAERLINVCLLDLNDVIQYTSNALMVISLVLKKIREGKCKNSQKLDERLIESAKTITSITKKLLTKPLLRKMAIDTLLLHPDHVLEYIACNPYEDFFDLLDFYAKVDFQFQYDVTGRIVSILKRVLKILDEGSKIIFVRKGLKAWFNSIIPGVVAAADESPESLKENIPTLEVLVEILIKLDYSEFDCWHVILKEICDPKRYPAMLKKLVEGQNDSWHRLWMVFIKLLKDQLTKVNKIGFSPINALLPVLELAFKLDAECRCRAFECWNILIEIFSTELNETLINKRLKLLIIPLKLNNAKAPQTVVAKFKTWWHLIRKFQSKVDKYTDVVLIPFLQFCFGKSTASSKPTPTPGLLTDEIAKQCVEALVEIIGHVECEGCVSVPRLQNRLISTKLLVDHWNEWLNALTVAVETSAVNCSENDIQRLKCIWRGFLMTIAELPANQIRADLVNELLQAVTSLAQNVSRTPSLADIVFDVLVCSLFDHDQNIRLLMKTKTEEGPIHSVVKIIYDPHLTNVFIKKTPEELIAKLKPITDFIMEPTMTDSDKVVSTLVIQPHFSENKLIFWAALADTYCESKYELDEKTLTEVIFWPLKAEITTSEALQVAQSEAVWYKWYTLYSYLHPIMPTNFDEQIKGLIKEENPFCLCATIALLKQKLCVNKNKVCHQEAKTLLKLVEKVHFKSLVKYVPIIIDTLVLLVNFVTEIIDFDLAQTAISIIMIIFKHAIQALKARASDSDKLVMDVNLLDHLIKPVDILTQIEKYSTLVPNLALCLSDLAKVTVSHTAFNKGVIEILNKSAPHLLTSNTTEKVSDVPTNDSMTNEPVEVIIVKETRPIVIDINKPTNSENEKNKSKPSQIKKTKIKISKAEQDESHTSEPKENERRNFEIISNQSKDFEAKKDEHKDSSVGEEVYNKTESKTDDKNTKNIHVDNSAAVTSEKQQESKTSFATPGKKSVKKTKKKGPNIERTVVENGEEFVVVKSHWQFNPRKLTENQKEKLNRKREDIPALYQDLSQSQDEFKLSTWKPDSLDTSTNTSSKSESNNNTNNDVPNILKNIPSTDVVPKIIENIFPQNINDNDKNMEKPSAVTNETQISPAPVVKSPKTPRLALKERVFRNVRNLIEKSGTQSASKIIELSVEDVIKPINENEISTPVNKVKPVTNMTNSAPSKITSERPFRAIKKPKKFDDAEIFAMKKRKRSRNSQNDSQSPSFWEDDTKNKPEPIVVKETPVPERPANLDVATDAKTPSLPVEKLDIIETPEHKKPDDIPNTETHTSQIENSQIITENVQPNLSNSQDVEKVNVGNVTPEKLSKENETCSQRIEEISSPKPTNKRKEDDQSSIKKKRSRIERQLLIDMVEGHPLLQQSQLEKRMTRKNITDPKDTVSKRRKSLIEKSLKIKAELKNAGIVENKKGTDTSPTASKSNTEQNISNELIDSQTVIITESQDSVSEISDDMPMSEDVIESSQDSSITTISVKSSASKKRVPIVRLDIENPLAKNRSPEKNLLNDIGHKIIPFNISFDETKDDIELSKNKTMVNEKTQDLTESMDTEPLTSSGDIVFVDNDIPTPIVINTENTCPGKETQELAEADTLPMDVESQSIPPTIETDRVNNTANDTTVEKSQVDNNVTNVTTQADITSTISGTAEVIADIIQESSNTGSPSRDELQRKKEFLNDTIELSPIKILSPVKEVQAQSPETSNEYVVIKLATPVQINGEPFSEKCDSPEIFTEEKVSPDKRDQSPPRKEVTPSVGSPNSSLSLRKNKPQIKFNGRAAQMLQLCAPNAKRLENDEAKKEHTSSTPVRRNLRKVYTADSNDNQTSESSEENENFLKFTRPVPSADSSPAGPILKRKHAEMDEATPSPASKVQKLNQLQRKRVSFHDPPVSTTVAVQKYIEPLGVRSPSNSGIKRQERQLRALTNAKSPKRLENVFRLDTVLTKTIESFSQEVTASNDTEMSLDETPAVEIVKTWELNDKDPICAELLDCRDPIENIAGELSSPSTKILLIKELEGKVETVADLAKMTELEVNRLCIKAPKVKVAKKVLTDYAAKRAKTSEIEAAKTPVETVTSQIVEKIVETVNVEVQTNAVVTNSSEIQTEVMTSMVQTQTEKVPTAHCSTQVQESTKDIVESCLARRPDFVDELTKRLDENGVRQITQNLLQKPDYVDMLSNQLDEKAVRQISEKLPLDSVLTLIMNKMTSENSEKVLNTVVTRSTDFKDNTKDLILFCIQLLQKIYDK